MINLSKKKFRLGYHALIFVKFKADFFSLKIKQQKVFNWGEPMPKFLGIILYGRSYNYRTLI